MSYDGRDAEHTLPDVNARRDVSGAMFKHVLPQRASSFRHRGDDEVEKAMDLPPRTMLFVPA